jgi:hypothetical protein
MKKGREHKTSRAGGKKPCKQNQEKNAEKGRDTYYYYFAACVNSHIAKKIVGMT